MIMKIEFGAENEYRKENFQEGEENQFILVTSLSY